MTLKRSRRAALTLVEVLVVVLISGVLLAYVIRDFSKSNNSANGKAIAATLMLVDAAKERCAIDRALKFGDTCPNTSTYLSDPPSFPISGAYVEGAIGTPATFASKDADHWITWR